MTNRKAPKKEAEKTAKPKAGAKRPMKTKGKAGAPASNSQPSGAKSGKHPGGRPTAYDPAMCQKVTMFCMMGMTDVQLAVALDVDERTIYRWKAEYPEFRQAVKEGKDEADAKVARALYHRATGYSHKAVKMFQAGGSIIAQEYVEHYPPDTGAAFIWLKNRQPHLWRDRVEVSSEDLTGLSPEQRQELDRRYQIARERGWAEQRDAMRERARKIASEEGE